ncbi:MAG: alginate O-acetyltransferase [Bacteroidetes bacterium GWE2_29_8]|nr:MAG: alginate O-acetyltransferase [Bacteroidetes bacterium GWE2_29_8]OFY13987.1 MAG: alginate O-acetyltransferase [Bacteroidetes bacterium GWF2_29_10]
MILFFFDKIDQNNLFNIFLYNPKEPIIFNSGFFLFIFCVFLLFYTIIHKHKTLQICYIILFSFYFYYKSSGIYFILLFLTASSDFLLANLIYKSTSLKYKRLFLTLSLLINLSLLGYFKYTNFFIKIFNDFAINDVGTLSIILPVGISFFIFQSLSYTIDIYRGKIIPVISYFDFLFFISFFPQLVAGPIVRASDFIPQIRKNIVIKDFEISRAIFLIISGLVKKAIISDYISINFVDRIFDNPLLYSGFENLMAVYAYALQIYCDFSGYSDMAIGIALLMGFNLSINFNSPYQSSSITEFWRRWHISLSTWLKDYLYISMGGNRKGKIRQYFNLLITMLLGGLWHGASWKFVIWGGIHGIVLIIEKIFNRYIVFKQNIFTKTIGVIITFHIVCLCWIFFRASDYNTSLNVITQIAYNFDYKIINDVLSGYKNVFILCLFGYFLHFIPEHYELKTIKLLNKTNTIVQAFILAIIIWIVIQVKSAEILPYIYFQF